MSRRLLTCSLAGLALTVTALPTVAEAAPRRPDLKVTAVSAPTGVQAGAVLTVTVTTRNAGKATARASTTRVHLSADAKPGGDLAVGTVKVKKLTKGKRRTATVRLVVPAGAAAATYRVLACADAKKKVKESKERNNCRVAKGAVVVTRPVPPPPPPPPNPTFPLEPNPVSASGVTLDPTPAARVTKLIDPADPSSLTVTTTGTDGTVYSLAFPPESLLSAEEITMTPLVTAELPVLDRFVAGVKLEPEGLMLQAPAILTITRNTDTGLGPVAEQVPYVFHEEGEDFHEHPIVEPQAGEGANTLRMPLTHFSVAGVGGGTAAQQAQLTQHPPVRTQGQLSSTISGMVNDARNGGAFDAAPARAALVSYYDNVVDPRLAAAETDAALAPGAIAEAIALLRQLALLGEEDGPTHDKVKARLKPILDNLVQHWWNRCTQQHDLNAIAMLIGLARQRMLLGFDSDENSQAFEYARRCSSFDIDLKSTLDWARDHDPQPNASFDGTAHLHLESTVPIEFGGPGFGVLDYAEGASVEHHYVVTDDSCTCTIDSTLTHTVPGWLKADVLARANPRDPGPMSAPPSPPTPFVRIDPGMGAGGPAPPQEQMHEESSPVGEPRDYAATFWMDGMLIWSHGYPLRWEYDLKQTPATAVMVDETIDETFGSVSSMSGQFTTYTTIKLTHTPD